LLRGLPSAPFLGGLLGVPLLGFTPQHIGLLGVPLLGFTPQHIGLLGVPLLGKKKRSRRQHTCRYERLCSFSA